MKRKRLGRRGKGEEVVSVGRGGSDRRLERDGEARGLERRGRERRGGRGECRCGVKGRRKG